MGKKEKNTIAAKAKKLLNTSTSPELLVKPVSSSVTPLKQEADKQEVDFENLETSLMSKIGTDKEQTVVVRIPFNLQVQDLVDVLQIGVKNNLKFVIATSPK